MRRLLRNLCMLCATLIVVGALLPVPARAQQEPDPVWSSNVYGGLGLITTRTARMRDEGEFEVGLSAVFPYRRYYMTWQILSSVEATFRYSDIRNVQDFDTIGEFPGQNQGEFFSEFFRFKGGASFLDRSIDLKVHLFSEGDIMPEIAVGFQDLGGTGIWSSEYIVATKAFGRFDATLGMAWGQLGSRATFGNPFKIFGSRFQDRTPKGRGLPGIGEFFHGATVGLFGGLEYRPDVDGLTFKIEYDGADPETVPGTRQLDGSFPINFGVNYRPTKWWEVSLGLQRGDAIMFRTALRTNLHLPGLKKPKITPPDIKVRQDEMAATRAEFEVAEVAPGAVDTATLKAEMQTLGVLVPSIQIQVLAATIDVEFQRGYAADIEAQIARVAFLRLPDTVREVHVRRMVGTAALTRVYTRKMLLLDQLIETANAVAGSNAPVGAELSDNMMQLQLPFERGDLALIAGLYLQTATHIAEGSVVIDGRTVLREERLVLATEAQTSLLFANFGSVGVYPSSIEIAGDTLEIHTDQSRTEVNAAAITEQWLYAVSQATGYRGLRIDTDATDSAEDLDMAELATRLFGELGRYSIGGYALNIKDKEATIYLYSAPFRNVAKNMGWTVRVATQVLPDDIERITVVELLASIETQRVSFLRNDFERYATANSSAEETLSNVIFEPLGQGVKSAKTDGSTHRSDLYPSFTWWFGPQLLQSIGDPKEGLIRIDIDAEVGFSYAIDENLSVSGAVRRFLFGNLDKITRKSDSQLPHVRSDIVEYLQNGRTSIAKLQADYVFNLTPEVYARASVGLFEPMFGGVSGEVLYRPFGEPWAVSLDINWVKQRGYKQLLSFRDYDVVTGHARIYYDLPWQDVRIGLSAGRYLAGDWGATLDVSRQFDSGVRVGAFATLTDVPFSVFGEGSFDKGFYMIVPIETLLPMNSRRSQGFLFRPLTRDGGQQLSIGPQLYALTELGGYRNIMRDWSGLYD